jgi:hypothetical protein
MDYSSAVPAVPEPYAYSSTNAALWAVLEPTPATEQQLAQAPCPHGARRVLALFQLGYEAADYAEHADLGSPVRVQLTQLLAGRDCLLLPNRE